MQAQQLQGVCTLSDVREEPAPWPYFEEDEIEAAAAVLRSGRVNYWTGEEGHQFETEFAAFVGARHGVAVANGTVALELALHACGIGPGDEVIVTSRTFIASASCAVMRGASPVMADIDRTSQNITAETIRAVLTPRTRAIIAVHFAGWPCDMDPILDVARQYDLKVIEDCAQAHGAIYKGRQVGSMGDAAAFSFCQDKIMTTGGEGGMLVTNDPVLWEKAWAFKDHGKNHEKACTRDNALGACYVHDSFGTNWRLSEMQSAIGRLQLRKLPRWLHRRRQYGALLNEALAGVTGLRITLPPAEIAHAYYKYYAFVELHELLPGWSRDRIIVEIRAGDVPCFTGSASEIYLEKAFPSMWQPSGRMPVAKELGETSLMFTLHPTYRPEHMQRTCEVVARVMRKATGR